MRLAWATWGELKEEREKKKEGKKGRTQAQRDRGTQEDKADQSSEKLNCLA